jgi:hypothetical protein
MTTSGGDWRLLPSNIRARCDDQVTMRVSASIAIA